MKLLQILARELEGWPEPDEDYGLIESMAQAADLQVSHYAGVRQKWLEDIGDWEGGVSAGYVPCSRFALSQLATDHATAIVTRADWEAERAKLKSPKANGDGWIRHRGGKFPVDGGVMVDTRHRDGDIVTGLAGSFYWRHRQINGDIMRYKIHKPAEQPSGFNRGAIEESVRLARIKEDGWVEDTQAAVAALSSSSAPVDTMLAIRDRIRELDTHRAEVESTYQRQIGEIDGEREGLVERLAGEGLSLIERINAGIADAKQAHDGMDDWRNWKAGDLVVCIDTQVPENEFTPGSQYIIDYMEKRWCNVVEDDEGDENALPHESFKWHSRPAR